MQLLSQFLRAVWCALQLESDRPVSLSLTPVGVLKTEGLLKRAAAELRGRGAHRHQNLGLIGHPNLSAGPLGKRQRFLLRRDFPEFGNQPLLRDPTDKGLVGRERTLHVSMAGAATLLGLLLAARCCFVVVFELEGLQVVILVICVDGAANSCVLLGDILGIRLDRYAVQIRDDQRSESNECDQFLEPMRERATDFKDG